VRWDKPNVDRVAHVNNLREKQFGVSPKDRPEAHWCSGWKE
jgi:hypothetical protein